MERGYFIYSSYKPGYKNTKKLKCKKGVVKEVKGDDGDV